MSGQIDIAADLGAVAPALPDILTLHQLAHLDSPTPPENHPPRDRVVLPSLLLR